MEDIDLDLEHELEMALEELDPSDELPIETFYIALKNALIRLNESEFETQPLT